MGFELTPESLKKLCRDLKLYSSCPELNDVLHLQQKGIIKVQNLDQYTGLKTIYLECNAISVIEGLDHLTQLRCLYINQNLVEHIVGLENLKLLETLDISDNQIRTIQGLSGCVALRQLNISGNRIRSKEDVEHLLECPSLISLDISKNRIEDEEALRVIRSLPLNLLRLCGNPILSKTWCYRKSTIACMTLLIYLDDSPVFEKERRIAHAWVEGGLEAEKLMRETIRREEADLRAYHHKAFQDMINKARADAAAKKQQEIDKQNVSEEEPQDDVRDMEETEATNSSNKRDGSDLKNMAPLKCSRILYHSDCKEQMTCTSDDLMDLDGAVCTVEEDLVCDDPAAPKDENQDRSIIDFCKDANNAVLKMITDELCERRLQWVDKEKEFKRQLQEKVLQRAAYGAETTDSRPVIWGTKRYRELWAAAATIDDKAASDDDCSDCNMEVESI